MTMNFELERHSSYLDFEVIGRLIDLSDYSSQGDDAAFFDEMVALFAATVPGIIEEIEKSLVDRDTAALVHHAHRLKGVSYNMGARLMGEYCSSIEDEAKLGQAPPMHATVRELMTFFEKSTKELEEVALRQRPPRPDLP